MRYKIKERDEHFKSDATPKQILGVDGGGLPGILALGSYLGSRTSLKNGMAAMKVSACVTILIWQRGLLPALPLRLRSRSG